MPKWLIFEKVDQEEGLWRLLGSVIGEEDIPGVTTKYDVEGFLKEERMSMTLQDFFEAVKVGKIKIVRELSLIPTKEI
ncbi:MAG: hypothetical protein V1686_01220 [Patescibacteria group bacterium]